MFRMLPPDTMHSKEIIFTDSTGINLAGILSMPAEGYDIPVVIACHGFASSKNTSSYITLESDLIQNEIAIFRYDFFGHGESEGDFADITLSKAVDSIIKAYELLISLGFSKIALLGTSFGGCAAFNAAAVLNDKLCCLVGKCPLSDYAKQREEKLGVEGMEEYKKNGYYWYKTFRGETKKLNYSFYEDMRNNNVHEKAHLITIPTLIVHGELDETVKVEQSIKTASLMPNCRLEIIEGAGHQFDVPADAMERIEEIFISFLKEYRR